MLGVGVFLGIRVGFWYIFFACVESGFSLGFRELKIFIVKEEGVVID